MALHKNDILLIEKYLDGDLSPEESILFEAKRVASPEFNEEASLHEKVIRSISTGQKKELKSELKHLYGQVKEEKATTRKQISWYRLVAILCIMGTAALIYLMISPSSKQPTLNTGQLFVKYYEPYTNERLFRSKTTNISHEAMDQYQQQQFSAALPLFEKLLAGQPDNDELLLFIGSCHLTLNQTGSALTHFEKASLSTEPSIQQHGIWYMALLYLKEGRQAEVIELLDRLVKEENKYTRDARDIIEMTKTVQYK